PVPAEVALRLIADAGWQRILYQPLTGALLEVGTTVHDPPAALREHVLVRDGGCTQPICGTARVDLDHNVPFPHGPTSAANLRSRCRHHHRLKQHPDWQARVRPDGRIDWITPTGHSYPEHEPDLRPAPSTRPRPDPDIGSDIGPDPPPGADDRPPF
ncbi:MAG: HNH endonuclease, partial [Actinomycetota bacterium]|nr:HNH endonuclease [Actinomycetota bacterium]